MKVDTSESQSDAGEKTAGTSLVFGGDFCPIRRYEEKMLRGEEIFDPKLQALLRDHLSIVNLEAPLCDPTLPRASLAGGGLRGSPEVAAYLKRLHVDAWSLANNHILDFRGEGIQQTKRHLQQEGMVTCGAGDNSHEAAKPLELRANGLRIGIWAVAERELNLAGPEQPGAAEFCPQKNVDEIRRMREEFDFLAVSVHAGHEFTTVPSPRIRSAYRSFIEAGADAVIGHHPHVIQGMERHGEGFIAYSLGNLVFDSPYVSAYKDTDVGFLLKLDIGKHQVRSVEAVPYRLGDDFVVAALPEGERAAFDLRLEHLSRLLGEEEDYQTEWKKNVRFRWETEYRRILSNFSTYLLEQTNPDFPRRARNLFTSPTHVEMIEAIMFLLEDPEGGLHFS